MDHEHVARRNSKDLGYTAGEVARPSVRKVEKKGALPQPPAIVKAK